MTLVGLSTTLPANQRSHVANWWMWESKCSSAIAKMAIYYDFQPHLHWVTIFHTTSLNVLDGFLV